MITIAVPCEPSPETRVALVPESVRALTRAGHRVLVERGAGARARYPDAEYAAAGAKVVGGVDLAAVDVLAHVTPLPARVLGALRPGAVTIGLQSPLDDADRLAAANARGVTMLAFERLPRTSRAQAMDALSSQALAAGYRCVLEAAVRLPRFFPLAMTAAGTVPPAKVVVLGIGVAGLQAIATARRLGAKVAANDIRPDSAEEARSVGATFLDTGLDAAEGTGAGGYARALGTSAAERQRAALAPHIADADVLITTAAVPGRPAPRLVTTEMVAAMRPGSVVVDLAAATGGNVEGSRPGEDVRVPSGRGDGAVTVVGLASAPSDLPTDASRLYATNVVNVLGLLVKDGALTVPLDDDIVAGMALTHDGETRAAGAAPAPAAPAVPQDPPEPGGPGPEGGVGAGHYAEEHR
ncbi:NAD(P) transhydrogenase subunit alpha [Georgenia thermotolerans]|uniref:proton-translocating NAD(P)(+) transhydrogenase n=1 Tax=Georgenia thermotolerans TaxID=527326 RepID=A0A7J5UQN7_9MICO|nr:NAD(P) transhydrogenase subunit alpha [Georgenia thermotolerans]KAE8764736.1 NAD(P)(+) transhydrogenase (Re/Si-specific) subunit alpha [Georgenia thermotolerans]